LIPGFRDKILFSQPRNGQTRVLTQNDIPFTPATRSGNFGVRPTPVSGTVRCGPYHATLAKGRNMRAIQWTLIGVSKIEVGGCASTSTMQKWEESRILPATDDLRADPRPDKFVFVKPAGSNL
jgi:hypothetical protein